MQLREAAVDLDAIRHNVAHIVRLTGCEVIAVVKANGYGHGASNVARAALSAGAMRLGVADCDEAEQLRSAGIDAPILAWLHGPATDFRPAIEQRIGLGVSSLDQLHRAASAATKSRPAEIHLKLDTGLHRNGIPQSRWIDVFSRAAGLESTGLIRVTGIFSHLANTSIDEDRAATHRFGAAIDLAENLGLRPVLRHLAATQAAFELPEARFDAVRIGLGLYGVPSASSRSPLELGLKPSMVLRAAVAAVRRVDAGSAVSYGGEHVTSRETTLVLVPLGYADGIPRQASGKGFVTIDGRRFPCVGRIAMDQMIADVGDYPVSVGDEVVVFGDPDTGAPSVDEWATAGDTISRDVLCGIGTRVPRIYHTAGRSTLGRSPSS